MGSFMGSLVGVGSAASPIKPAIGDCSLVTRYTPFKFMCTLSQNSATDRSKCSHVIYK